MNIFQPEIDAGLSETLSAKSSIVYASQVEKSTSTSKDIEKKQIENIKALAGLQDSDLYYTQSILVTTSWNKNDDIFDPREVWMAKDTPTHKPTNLEHNEKVIVGHITSNWPIGEDGQIIDENVSPNELPDKFHILTGSVIYTGFTEPELRERSQKLIAEIEDGEKYVSMECFFKGFDYGLIDKASGKYHILPRNEETAFLTQHLRAYGGQGEHQNYKIGRVLRSITFSGKGFVSRPANPESIIFTLNNLQIEKQQAEIINHEEKKDNSTNIGVFSIQANLKEMTMSVEQDTAQTDNVTEVPVAEATTVVETPVQDAQIVAELEALKVEHEEAAKKMAEDMKKKDEEVEKMKAELLAASEVIAAYKSKEAEMMKQEKKNKRMATLVEKGVDTELASATVEKLENVDDEAFESMTSLIAGKMPDWLMKNKKDKPKASEVTPEESALETAEVTEDVTLSVGSESPETEMQSTRAALVEFVCNRLSTKLNKGE
jgi:hypothetical protein